MQLSNGLHIALITIADLPEGGGNTSRLRRLARTLASCGHNVEIWNEHALGVAPDDRLEAAGQLDGIPFEYVLGTTARGSRWQVVPTKGHAVMKLLSRVWQAGRKQQLDLIWFNNTSFYNIQPISLLAKVLGIPTIQGYEDEWLELHSVDENRGLAGRLFAANAWLGDRLCPSQADAIVVISHYLKDKYQEFADPGRIHLIPTIIDCDEWRCDEELNCAEPMIFYSGAFAEQDELPNLIEALAILRQRSVAFRCVFLGGNTRDPQQVEAARRQVQIAGLADIVEMPGFVPLSEVRRQLEAANILVNIRRDGIWSRSGLSTKLSEYLASGRLVVSSAVGEVPYYLKHGEDALLVSEKVTPGEIADTLQLAIRDFPLRKRLGSAGRSVALANFDVSVVSEKLDQLLSPMRQDRKRQPRAQS
jgi:glycosyltransferase involved in cell wall biosynthesis